MSRFQDYLASSNVNESVEHINEGSKDIETVLMPYVKKLKSLLKHLPVEIRGGQIVVGQRSSRSSEVSFYATVTIRGELDITQPSHSDHTAETLSKMSNMMREFSDNFSFIQKVLKDAHDAEDAFFKANK